jgi:hypothetical protein
MGSFMSGLWQVSWRVKFPLHRLKMGSFMSGLWQVSWRVKFPLHRLKMGSFMSAAVLAARYKHAMPPNVASSTSSATIPEVQTRFADHTADSRTADPFPSVLK